MATPGANTSQTQGILNALSFTVYRLTLVIANRAYPGPDIAVDDGMAVVVKSDPGNALLGRIFVGSSRANAINPNLSWPLILNEAISLYVTNAGCIYVSGNTAGDNVLFIVEKARKS